MWIHLFGSLETEIRSLVMLQVTGHCQVFFRFLFGKQSKYFTFCIFCRKQIVKDNVKQQGFVCTQFISGAKRYSFSLYFLPSVMGFGKECWTKAQLWAVVVQYDHTIHHTYLSESRLSSSISPKQSPQLRIGICLIVGPTFLVCLSSLNPSWFSTCTSSWTSPVSSLPTVEKLHCARLWIIILKMPYFMTCLEKKIRL